MSNDVLTEVRFWAQVIGDAERTVICHPELESRCKGYVTARGLDHLITVLANRFCPEDKIFVIDGNALEASLRQALQRPIRLRP